MGCKSTKTVSDRTETIDYNFEATIQHVHRIWSRVRRIENLGPKTFAHMLFVNPMLKWHFNVSPTVKTQSDLARTAKVRELGIMFLTIYSAIIKNAKVNLDERIRSKAIVLNRQGIKPPVIQHFGESFYYIPTHQINIKLTQKEKESWKNFIDYVSAQLIAEMIRTNNNDS